MADILTYDRKHLRLFDNQIIVNESLGKWKNIEKVERVVGGDTVYITAFNDVGTTNNSTSSIITTNFNEGIEPPRGSGIDYEKLSDVAKMGLSELNTYIKERGLLFYLKSTGDYNNQSTLTYGGTPYAEDKKSFFDKLKDLFKKEEKEPLPEFDAAQFFTNIKATTKESEQKYINRIEKYLVAIKNARTVGQTALVEKLFREMIANKYESFLFAEGYYYVVTEQQVVDFAKKTEKGIAIDYIKNFVRPIPSDVIDKIGKAESLNVFDNFVIMHYDPEGKSTHDTAREEYKKRDPIVFGVIAGSTKLYYITDWIDEYCDLTLEKFVDQLGMTTDDLIVDEEEKAKVEKKREGERAAAEAAKKAKREKSKKKKEKEVKKADEKPDDTAEKTKRKTTKKQ